MQSGKGLHCTGLEWTGQTNVAYLRVEAGGGNDQDQQQTNEEIAPACQTRIDSPAFVLAMKSQLLHVVVRGT